jgi:hypothetical protein
MKLFIKQFVLFILIIVTVSCNNNEGISNKKSKINRFQNNVCQMLETLKQEKIIESKRIKEVPQFVISFLQKIRHEEILIADSGKLWNATDDNINIHSDTNLSKQAKEILRFGADSQIVEKTEGKYKVIFPNKKLVSFAKGKTVAYISFLNGGFIAKEDFYIVKFNKDSIVDYWHGVPPTSVENKESAIVFMSSNCP